MTNSPNQTSKTCWPRFWRLAAFLTVVVHMVSTIPTGHKQCFRLVPPRWHPTNSKHLGSVECARAPWQICWPVGDQSDNGVASCNSASQAFHPSAPFGSSTHLCRQLMQIVFWPISLSLTHLKCSRCHLLIDQVCWHTFKVLANFSDNDKDYFVSTIYWVELVVVMVDDLHVKNYWISSMANFSSPTNVLPLQMSVFSRQRLSNSTGRMCNIETSRVWSTASSSVDCLFCYG